MRIVGLPIDEFIPAIALAAFFFLVGKVILSIAVPVLIVVLIKIMKRGQGSAWLINLCHWYLPKRAMHQVLRKTPPSQNREYIA